MVDQHGMLAPGRLRILDITEFRLPGRAIVGDWSCTRCGAEHPTSESWSVVFDTTRGPRSMVLCPRCTEEYRSVDGRSADLSEAG